MLTLRNQLWFDTETAEGVLATLTVADALYALEAKGTVERDELTESRSQRTLSKTVSRIGQSRAQFTFGLDLKGGGTTLGVPNPPELRKPFLASGMREERLYTVIPGPITGGPIDHLETFLQAGTLATGIIVGSYDGNPTRLHYRALVGSLNNVGLVTTSGGATFTPTDPSPLVWGWMYSPTSEIWSSSARGAWTGTPTQYEIVSGATSGAKGVLLDAGLPLGGAGTVYVQVLLGTFDAAGEVITGVTSGATTTITAPGFVQIWNTSASIGYLLDGLYLRGTGCRGTFKAPLVTGAPCKVDFEFNGLEHSVTDLVLPTGAVFDTTFAPRFVDANWSMDGFGFYISQLEIDMGNVLNTRPDANALEGAISHEITDRDPVVRLDPEMLPPGVYDYFAKWRAATTAAAKIRLGAEEDEFGTSTAVGRIVGIDMPAIQYRNVGFGDRNNRVTADIEGGLRQANTDGNNELIFYFL